MNYQFLWIKLVLLLTVLNNIQSFPTRNLSDDEWNLLLELIGKSKNLPSYNNEYYESFTLKPIIYKMDFDDDFYKKDLNKLTLPKITNNVEKVPEETSFWTSVKTFFTEDLNSMAKEVADNYNPIPTIASVIDDVKRSDTWNDVNSFFTKGYNRLVKFSESVIDDLKGSIREEQA